VETTTPISIESAAEALMTPVESETTETEAPETEVAEVEEEEVEQESEPESDDDAEYAESDDDDDDDEYEASDEDQADQAGPETFSVKINGENVDVTLDDLKRDYSGQQYIQKGMKQAAEQRKQAEEAFNGLSQQRAQLEQLMQQVGQQGILTQPTPPTKDLLNADPLGYIEADASYREEMGAYQAQQQELGQQHQAMQQQQGQAHQAHLQSQMAELQQAIPDFGDAKKAPKMKERLVKQGMAEGYTAEEIGGIVDHRAMKVLHKAMLYDQMVAGGGDVQAKLKKARPLMKAGTKKQPTNAAKKYGKQMSKLKKSGSIDDAAALLFNS
jgi:prefoldin subunit 5